MYGWHNINNTNDNFMIKYFLIGLLIAISYLAMFYAGYIWSIDIFEFLCFKTDLL